jgi:hypothetical protein
MIRSADPAPDTATTLIDDAQTDARRPEAADAVVDDGRDGGAALREQA